MSSLLCGPCDQLVDETHVCPFNCTTFLKPDASCKSTRRPSLPPPPAEYTRLFGSEGEENEKDEDVVWAVQVDDTAADRRPHSARPVVATVAAGASLPSSGSPSVDAALRYVGAVLMDHHHRDLVDKVSTLTESTKTIASERDAAEQKRDNAEQERNDAQRERDAAKQDALDKERELANKERELTNKEHELSNRERELATLKRKFDDQPAIGLAQAITKPSCEAAYVQILNIVTTAYKNKAAHLKANFAPPPPTQPPSNASAAPVVMIIQKNSNPNFLTEREIKYEATGAKDELFYYDSGSTPWSPTWTAMDATLSATIASTLGSVDATKRVFSTVVGRNMTYQFNQHSYNVKVVQRPYPVAPAPPAPPAAPTVPWEVEVLLKGEFARLDKSAVLQWLVQFDFEVESSKAKTGGTLVANVAEMFTSFGTPTKFDPKKCELWIKPHWLKTWLLSVVKREYTEIRIGMHGMSEGPYDLLFNDISGSDPIKSSHHNAMGYGFYVSASNEIASYYGRHARVREGSNKVHNYGTALIGLIATTQGKCADPEKRVNDGALAFYPLAHTIGVSVKYPSRGACVWNDAFCVRDQTTWLPIGLACAKK